LNWDTIGELFLFSGSFWQAAAEGEFHGD